MGLDELPALSKMGLKSSQPASLSTAASRSSCARAGALGAFGSSGKVSPPALSGSTSGKVADAEQSERVLRHVVAALQGFFRSIALGSSDSIQDLLRLLTLWFRYGGDSRVESALLDGFDVVDIDM